MLDGDKIVRKWRDILALQKNVEYYMKDETVAFLRILDCCYVAPAVLRESIDLGICLIGSEN